MWALLKSYRPSYLPSTLDVIQLGGSGRKSLLTSRMTRSITSSSCKRRVESCGFVIPVDFVPFSISNCPNTCSQKV